MMDWNSSSSSIPSKGGWKQHSQHKELWANGDPIQSSELRASRSACIFRIYLSCQHFIQQNSIGPPVHCSVIGLICHNLKSMERTWQEIKRKNGNYSEKPRLSMNGLRNTVITAWICVHACVCVCVCVSTIYSPCGEVYCISPKMADAGESMDVYIRESMPRGSTVRFTISKTCTTVTASFLLLLQSTNHKQAQRVLRCLPGLICLLSLHTGMRLHTSSYWSNKGQWWYVTVLKLPPADVHLILKKFCTLKVYIIVSQAEYSSNQVP